MGCIHTALEQEFDYIGASSGPDLPHAHDEGRWVGDAEASHHRLVPRAKKDFEEHVKNTYRVRRRRGLKECYVHVMDRDTKRFLTSRLRDDQR